MGKGEGLSLLDNGLSHPRMAVAQTDTAAPPDASR